MRRSIVLSLPLQLVFPGWIFERRERREKIDGWRLRGGDREREKT
jgi:hypothetical protein